MSITSPTIESLDLKKRRMTIRQGDISFTFLSSGISASATSTGWDSTTAFTFSAASVKTSDSSDITGFFSSSIIIPLNEFNARVNHCVHKVGKQYAEYRQECKEHIIRHDNGYIALHHGVKRIIAYTG